MVPFLRAVRGEKEESRSDQAERSEGATNWGQGSPEFGSFPYQCCLKRWKMLTKIGTHGLHTMPHGLYMFFWGFGRQEASYFARKVEKCAFWQFSGEFDSTKETKRGPKASRGG